MKTKRVNRYYCDFCKKAGCNKYWIRKHEERCTKNPNRYCGFCHLLEQDQPDLEKAIQLLPDPEKHHTWDEFGNWHFTYTLQVEIDKAMPKLRYYVENCPACIMAALRQRGIPVPMATDFDFKKEAQSIWGEFNAAQMEKENMQHYG